jgi:hypothetical protein
MIETQDIHRVLDIATKMALHKLEDSFTELNSPRTMQHGMRKFYIKEYPFIYRDKISLYRNVSIISLHYAEDMPSKIQDITDFEDYLATKEITDFIVWLNTAWSKVIYNKIMDMVNHNIIEYQAIIDSIRNSSIPCAVNYSNLLDTIFKLNHIR